MATRKVDALVLAEDAAPTGEPQVFPGFPGTYLPGEPVTLDELGLGVTEARKLIKDLHLPLSVEKLMPPKREEPPVAGRHYDADELEPGDAIPSLTPAARIASAPEGLALPADAPPPPSVEPPPLEAEAVRANAEAAVEPDEVA